MYCESHSSTRNGVSATESKKIYTPIPVCLHCTILTCFTVLMQAGWNAFNNESFLIKNLKTVSRTRWQRKITLVEEWAENRGPIKTLHSVPLNKGVPSGVLYPFYCPRYKHNLFPSIFMVCQIFIPSFPASRFPSFHFPPQIIPSLIMLISIFTVSSFLFYSILVSSSFLQYIHFPLLFKSWSNPFLFLLLSFPFLPFLLFFCNFPFP